MVELPYEVVVPYSTCVSLASLVVQLIVAPEELTPDADTPELREPPCRPVEEVAAALSTR